MIDLGDVGLARGFPVIGRVVEEQGAPLSEVVVGLDNLPLPLAPEVAANDTRYGRSAADGSFRPTAPTSY